MLKSRAVLLLAAVSAAVSGCAGKLVTGRIEKGITQRLPEIIGPAESYKVNVDGGLMKLRRGKIDRVEIVGHGVRPGGKYYLDQLTIVLTGIKANTKTQSVESVDQTEFSAVLAEPSLNRYLRGASPRLKDLNVDVKSGRMTVHTRPSLSRFSTSVDLTGDLRIKSGTKLEFVVDRLTVAGLNAPGFVIDFVESRINPVLDIAGFGFPAHLESVTLRADEIELKGTADLSKGLPSAGNL